MRILLRLVEDLEIFNSFSKLREIGKYWKKFVFYYLCMWGK